MCVPVVCVAPLTTARAPGHQAAPLTVPDSRPWPRWPPVPAVQSKGRKRVAAPAPVDNVALVPFARAYGFERGAVCAGLRALWRTVGGLLEAPTDETVQAAAGTIRALGAHGVPCDEPHPRTRMTPLHTLVRQTLHAKVRPQPARMDRVLTVTRRARLCAASWSQVLLPLVELLLQMRADPNKRDGEGRAMTLWPAASTSKGARALLQLLEEHGADRAAA